jgi:hypothetical protein
MLLKQRNSGNSGWIIRASLSETRVVPKTATYTVVVSDFGQVFKCSNSMTLAFDAAATLGDGFYFDVANVGSGTVNLDPNSTEQIDGATLVALSPGQTCRVWCNGSAFTTVGRTVATVTRGQLAGLTMSTAGGSGTMSIAAGQAADSTNTVLMFLGTAINKTTAAWTVGSGNGGLDTSSIAASTWYHFHEIMRPDTGVVDVLFSLSATAPTLPANYTYFRRIGSGLTNGSSQWVAFIQDGDYFQWLTPVRDVNVSTPGSSAVARTLTVPVGVNVIAVMNALLTTATSDGLYLSDLATNDMAPSSSVAPLATVYAYDTAGTVETGQVEIRTNTSGQIRSRVGAGGSGSGLIIATLGWKDRRGRDA